MYLTWSLYFLPEKIRNNFLMGSYYWKKPDIIINWKLLELLIHFIVYIIIRCFHLFIESLHSKIPVMFVKWKKRQQRKRLQNKPIGPFCFFVKFDACVVFMDTRLFNYKYRNIRQTSYGNRHFKSCHSLYNCGHTFLPTSCSLFANTPHGTTPIVTSFRLNCLDRPSPKAALTCLVTPRSTYQ